jgi:hypothetical protein
MPRRSLADVARLVRSKNAGPFWLTIDVMFDNADVYRAAEQQHVFTPARLAALYRLPVEQVRVFAHPAALAFKVSFPRPIPSGSPGDADVFGGQQYAGVLELTVDVD